MMKKFNFTIHIVDQNASHDGLEDRLYEAGCDDALVCSSNNNVYLDFIRESKTLEFAIESAIQNINDANAKIICINVENAPYNFSK
ncbi:hypothetical protein [Acinetobacter sp. Marseille-Q1623]|uniref:hypothetical protein n=1 Tax=Acinetobacter sp. Marseille-Q1623 TaxID=2697501 RepID=UPI00157BAD96|nr:hypothetical protein [Acinetobacter sp. Marseille-Q1623]